VARLDALQASLWAKAEKGDRRAVNACVRIIVKRCRLQALYGDREAQKPPTDIRDPPPRHPWEGNPCSLRSPQTGARSRPVHNRKPSSAA